MLKLSKSTSNPSQGFALPLALVLGLITMTIMATSLIQAESSRSSSKVRHDSGASLIVSDSAIARALVELSKPENGVLLTRNYDPINPSTGKNYLGRDGIVNSNDETTTPQDEWTNYNPALSPCFQQAGVAAPNYALTGKIGDQGSYEILAYRYNPKSQTGHLLVRGNHETTATHMLVSVSVEAQPDAFPGIGLIKPYPDTNAGILALRGRDILGKNGNVYTIPESSNDPSLTGHAAPDDPNRNAYLNSVWSLPADGSEDPVDGEIIDSISGSIYACNLNINIPQGITGTNFRVIDTGRTFKAGRYTLEGIELDGTEELILDTTGGPVVLEFIYKAGQRFSLRDKAKILNIRTDGQPPRVGDARIIIRHDLSVDLYDETCISQVFLYSPQDEILLFTKKKGCPSGLNTNFEGVAWVEAILSSKNSEDNRNTHYLQAPDENLRPYDTEVFEDATSGIAVPDDVSSMQSFLRYIDLPMSYRYGEILSWQPVEVNSSEIRDNNTGTTDAAIPDAPGDVDIVGAPVLNTDPILSTEDCAHNCL